MFRLSHTHKSPWVIVSGAEREYMRIQAMRYVLSLFDYKDKSDEVLKPNPVGIKLFRADM